MRQPGNSILLLSFIFLCTTQVYSQQTIVPGTPLTLQNAPQRDTSKKTNTSDWSNQKAVIHYNKLNSQKTFHPDTSLHNFHRRKFSEPWYQNLGNSGSPVMNLMFTPANNVGPTLGYHAFDVYRFHPDSLQFYNTTRPFSSFTFQLGSKAEQLAQILHTQNINPNWNFAATYRKINSPGYYKIQRNNHDNGYFTTNYKGQQQHYQLKGAFIYNKEQTDENGGIVADSFLNNDRFDDRKTIPVLFENDGFSTRRSSVTNTLRDFSILLLHSYTWGEADTTYSEDSTQYSYRLIPRFSISHQLQLGSEKYWFKDRRPDSLRYTGLFEYDFAAGDSVFMFQKQSYTDNALMLNGFLGKEEKQLKFSAGIGIRTDNFTTGSGTGSNSRNLFSSYLAGELRKEALQERQWNYGAEARFFLTGEYAGNFSLDAHLGKEISPAIGVIEAGFTQRLGSAPYNYTIFQNQYFSRTKTYTNESTSLIYGRISNERFKLSAGIRNYIMANYIYLDEAQQFAQSPGAFNITQIWLRKIFSAGIFALDNELAYQQKTGVSPVNIPAFMGRHQLSVETYVFRKALKIATGVDVRYHTGYKPAGYSAFFNRFYYQDTYSVSNNPEVSLFFNFKIKNFRAYVMGDHFQQFFTANNTASFRYPTQDAMIRFGFNWVMVN